MPHDTPAAVPEDGFADFHALLDRLDAAIASGRAEDLATDRGSFTISETLQHAAQSVDYAMTGYPALKPAAVRNTIGRAVKHAFLRCGRMRHNLDAPVPGAPELDAAVPASAAAAGLRAAVQRLEVFVGTLHPHPVYGTCTPAQAARLQAMHLREHLPGLPSAL